MKYFLYIIFTTSVFFLTSCSGIYRTLTTKVCYVGNTQTSPSGGTKLAEVKGEDDDSEEIIEVTTYNYQYPNKYFPFHSNKRRVAIGDNDPSLRTLIPKETGIPASYQLYIQTRSNFGFKDWNKGEFILNGEVTKFNNAKRVSHRAEGWFDDEFLEDTIIEVSLDILNSWKSSPPNRFGEAGVTIRLIASTPPQKNQITGNSIPNASFQSAWISSAEVKVFLDKVKEVSKK